MSVNFHKVKFKPGKISYNDVLEAYSKNIFPMGEYNGTISWFTAEPRAVIPLNTDKGLKISHSLNQTLNKNIFKVRIDKAFKTVIRLCSLRRYTWINNEIIKLYTDLHEHGFAHSVEAYIDNKLAGGLYGVALNGAFFGESMFYLYPNASKICVVKLFDILKKSNFLLFDIQMITPVFKTFGAIEIESNKYLPLLKKAMRVKREFKLN
ncbi:MAG TPA: leucyl/phenylalanyl-tRNA--protein transferase [Ignavibacteria bacterium]